MGEEIKNWFPQYKDFFDWTLKHGWFEVDAFENKLGAHHYFLTPQGIMVCATVDVSLTATQPVIHTFIVKQSEEG